MANEKGGVTKKNAYLHMQFCNSIIIPYLELFDINPYHTNMWKNQITQQSNTQQKYYESCLYHITPKIPSLELSLFFTWHITTRIPSFSK